jgi:hypothetical protein
LLTHEVQIMVFAARLTIWQVLQLAYPPLEQLAAQLLLVRKSDRLTHAEHTNFLFWSKRQLAQLLMFELQAVHALLERKRPLLQPLQVKLPALLTEQLLQLAMLQGMHCICALKSTRPAMQAEHCKL